MPHLPQLLQLRQLLQPQESGLEGPAGVVVETGRDVTVEGTRGPMG